MVGIMICHSMLSNFKQREVALGVTKCWLVLRKSGAQYAIMQNAIQMTLHGALLVLVYVKLFKNEFSNPKLFISNDVLTCLDKK